MKSCLEITVSIQARHRFSSARRVAVKLKLDRAAYLGKTEKKKRE
jgi:hypothetical protein